jgi:glycosyltransferase involved in cell wall biosynthesis
VSFISHTALDEARAEGLLRQGLPIRVTSCGAESVFDETTARSQPDAMVDEERPFVLAIGAGYHHKNRVFSIRLVRSLRARGWNGILVLAGPTPPRGNSLSDETAEFLRDPSLREYVVDLSAVSNSEREWLYGHAALSIYPTVSEGFGLVPFESAIRGVPVLASRQGSLDEVLPSDLATLGGYELDAAVDVAWRLLHDEDERARNLEALTSHGATFTWERTATELVALFDEVMKQPRNRLAAFWGEGPAPSQVDEPLSSRHLNDAVEVKIQRLLGAERLKRAAIPDGSRRQTAARNATNWVRRTTTLS